MPAYEGRNELDLGGGKRLWLNGANFKKFLKPNNWTKWAYEIDFNQFFTSISNTVSFNTTTRTLNSNVNGVGSSVVLPTWNIIDDLTVAEEVATTSTAFANIVGLGQTLTGGAVYEMEIIVIYNSAATTTGINLSYSGVAAPTIYANLITIPTATNTQVTRNYAAPNTEISTTASSRIGNNIAIMKLIFGCSTTGLYYPRFATEVAGSAITIKRGTNLKIRRLS